MKRNFLRRGSAIVMAGVLEIATLLAVPALPAGAAETGTIDSAVINDGAMQEELSEDLNEELYFDVDSFENDDVEMPVSENNEETDEAGATRSGEATLTGTIGQPDEDGNTLEWSYDESTQTLTITGSGRLMGWELLTGALSSMEIRKIEFQDCKVVGDMSSAFRERIDLEEIDFSGLDTSGVTGMSAMFYGCSSLRSLDLSSFNTSSVIDMGLMFHYCSSLSGLELSSFDTSSVTSMERMFAGCGNLGSLDISNFNTSSVTNMWGMFENCSSLSGLELSSFDTSSVMDMEYMFYGCISLNSLDLGSFDTSSVTDMSRMFAGCSSLNSLDLGSFDTSNVTSMKLMFAGCSNLGSLVLSNFNTSNVTDMGDMFFGCSSLGSLDLSSFNTSNVTSMRLMFSECSSLNSLNLRSFNTSNVTDMHWMFRECSSLGSLDLRSFNTSNVTNMLSMFSECSSLESLDLSSFNTSNVTDMWDMFNGCGNLGSLDLSSFDMSNVTDMGTMFYGCGALATLHTPYNIKVSVNLPTISNAVWLLPDGTHVTELPQNLSSSVLITRSPVITTTTEALNMPDVIRVKYVPYSYTVQTSNSDPDNQVTFSVIEGRLAEGLQMYPATGEIYGVPLEAGEFNVTVQASYSNPKYPAAYAELKLIVLDNTDDNVGTATDSGYEITQPVPDINAGALSGAGTQLLVSEGEYAEFQDAVYLDGRRLQGGTEYTSEAGSTRVTIQNQTLANAGAGSHTLSLEFRTQDGDLRRAAQNLVISDVGGTGDAGNSGTTGNNGNTGSTGGNAGNSGDTDNNAGSSGSMDDNTDDGQDAASVSGTTTVIDYIVQSGDTLWRISGKFFGDSSHWRQIYADNMDVLRNPDRLRVGQHLKIYLTAGNGAGGAITIPAAAASGVGGSYVVQQGDNLWKIAGKVYGKSTRWREIYDANRSILSNPERLYTKQVLVIP